MTEKDFKNLDQFLKANRPDAPDAPSNELQAIQARLTPTSRKAFFLRPAVWGSLGTVAAALLVFIQLQRTPVVSPADDAGLIVYSAMVDFYDAEDSELIGDELSELTGFEDLN